MTLPKEGWIGWISSMVEAYNMAIYSFTAPFLAKLLFQDAATGSALFFSYSLVLLGSCLLYPIGAIYYGYLGDKQGRQKSCVYSTLGLALATGLMGLVPIHYFADSAWICFLVLLAAQHFFSGGEYHGSIVFSLEHLEEQSSGFMSSISCLFAVFGLAAANGLATLSTLKGDELWVRCCFLLGALGGLISYILKNHCQETPPFIALSRESLEERSIVTEWKKIGRVVMLLAFFTVSYTFIFVFLPLLYPEQGFGSFTSLLAYGFFLVLAGVLADRLGGEKVMLAGASAFSCAIIPLGYFGKNLFIMQLILTPCACLVIGPIHSWMLTQFEVRNRCRGIFISSAIATAIFGGSTVPLCLLIFEKSDSLAICCIYPLLVSFVSIAFLTYSKQAKEVAA